MAFKVVNDIVIKNDTNINVDGMDVLVGDGDTNTKVLLQNVQLNSNILNDSNLTSDNLNEGITNLYFNDLRAQAALAGDIATLQADIAQAIVDANSYTDAAVSGGTGSLTTDDIPEGSNLYYTNARVDARIPTTLSSFTNDSNFATVAYSDQSELDANAYTDTRETAITTAYTSAIATASAAGSSGSNTYTDQEVANAITSMTVYTDQAELDAIATAATDATNKDTALQSAMQTYTDQAEADAISTANAYTDTREVAITTAYQTYADQAETDAKAYTDTRETAITTAYQTYADQAEADAITTSNAYTDAKEVAITTAYQAYADARETDAVTTANAYTDNEVANLVDSAPAVLDTLNELAAALGDDPNFATTISNDIGTKVAKSGDTMTGDLTLAGAPTSANHAATKSYVDSAVAGGTGALDTDAIPEGAANLYYTDARADARATLRIGAANIGNLNNVSGGSLSTGDFLLYDGSEFAPVTFSTEVNTYADQRIAVSSIQDLSDIDGVDTPANGDVLLYDNSNNHFGFINLGNEINSYFDIRFATKNTNNLTEGSNNLYYTDARVDARIPTNVSSFTNDAGYLTAQSAASVATSGSYNDLSNKPTNVSAFTNDSNYSTFTSNQDTDTTSNVLFKTIEINTNNQTSETDLILNANSVIGSNNSINMALTDTSGTFRWWIGTNDHATGTAGGSTYMTLNSTQLSVTGEIVASGDVCAYSDRRLKRNIETIDNALDKVNNLRGVTFEKGLQPSLGVIAQEVEEVLPELVKTDSDGMKSVAYGNMVGLLIEAIKEQQKQIDDLKQRLKNT